MRKTGGLAAGGWRLAPRGSGLGCVCVPVHGALCRKPQAASRKARAGFTLIEVLVSVGILAAVTTVTFMVFSTVVEAWRRGESLSENLHHGDFVMEQIVGGLQSARYRTASDGFWIDDSGDGFSWVKEGADLVGEDNTLAKTYHRIHVFVPAAGGDDAGIAYTAWGDDYTQPDNFNPEELPPTILSRRVVGIGCRVATNVTESGIQWLDDWSGKIGTDPMTNHVPRYVEVTLRLQPLKAGEAPVEMKRCVEVPIAIQNGWK